MRARIPLLALALLTAAPAFAQEPVVGAKDPEALFTDKDPALNAEKQVALHIMRDLIQCNHWDEADKWLTEGYVQHNPNVKTGRAGLVAYFGKRPRTPTCDKLEMPVVAVVAEGDLVTVAIAVQRKDPRDPSKTYSTTWFDMLRIADGKAVEHWDCDTIAPPAK